MRISSRIIGSHNVFFGGKKTIMTFYVDDIIFTGDNLEEIERLKKKLSDKI